MQPTRPPKVSLKKIRITFMKQDHQFYRLSFVLPSFASWEMDNKEIYIVYF
ncbi:uncharacterized protein PHALS_12846 [Plasmopara halstedii]|uniref:Uncharacterized protein n=1 Tax=Plasmopara halstedii TaxID=4781 RepID=A0A0P1AMI1_PLAHL|nr:uncharacterized protein PHALS_12846 [Plasmopara halstedii]CEG42584.1 hypothetical protein PHALS_12846 [Plasmopara halstedii]|eukprot:XP_024578953.1 hypothetical protein PHALS_12846 [Plasmopara halstedii]